MKTLNEMRLVSLPVGADGVHGTFPVADKATAEWLSKLIHFAPAELLERCGPTPKHTGDCRSDGEVRSAATIRIARLSLADAHDLADEYGLDRDDCGSGVWVIWDDGTLPRGPFQDDRSAARSLAGSYADA